MNDCQETSKSDSISSILTFLLPTLFILFKIHVFVAYNLRYVGSDDLIYWLMASDYAQGLVHEPFFYGQNYLLPIESWLSAPFVVLGVKPFGILSIVTNMLALLPFFFVGSYLEKQKFRCGFVLVFLVGLSLPLEYDLLMSQSRGFVGGLFCASLLFLLNIKQQFLGFWFGLISFFSLLINPNAGFIPLFYFLHLWISKQLNRAFFIQVIPSSIIVGILYYQFKTFYIQNPTFLVNSMWGLNFSFPHFLKALKNMDSYFRFVAPFVWGIPFLAPLSFLLTSLILLRKIKYSIPLLFVFLTIIFSLGIEKVSNGFESIFYPYSRMFVALPILTGISLTWLLKRYQSNKIFLLLISIFGVLFFYLKTTKLETTIRAEVNSTKQIPVSVKSIAEIKKDCKALKIIADSHKIDLIIVTPNGDLSTPKSEFICYPCSFIEYDFPKTILNVWDKRSINFQYLMQVPQKRILIYNFDKIWRNNISDIDCSFLDDEQKLLLIKNNTFTVDQLSKKIGFKYKRHDY